MVLPLSVSTTLICARGSVSRSRPYSAERHRSMRFSSINMLVNSFKAKSPSLDTKGWSSGQLQEFGEAALEGRGVRKRRWNHRAHAAHGQQCVIQGRDDGFLSQPTSTGGTSAKPAPPPAVFPLANNMNGPRKSVQRSRRSATSVVLLLSSSDRDVPRKGKSSSFVSFVSARNFRKGAPNQTGPPQR